MKLLDSQVYAKKHLESWKVGALFMDAGTGKTRVACELINGVPDIDLVIWLCPLRMIKPNENVPSISDEVQKWKLFTADVLFVGIESIQNSDRIYFNIIDRIVSSQKTFVVVDESLKIKNAEAKRTKRILEIGKLVNYKLVLNGTPLSKNILDIWPQMEFLSPLILNMSLAQFKNTFCRYTTVDKRFGGRLCYKKEYVTGMENIDYLYSLIRSYIYRCDLKLNISQNYRNINFRLSDKNQKEYTRLKNLYLDIDYLEFKNNNIFLEMTQKMQHVYSCEEDKFNKLDNLFKDIPEEKTIIFCKFINSREACEKRYPKAKVLSYQSQSFGLNLQNYNYTVYFDKFWDYAVRMQSSRRTYRIGQEYDCYYYDMTGNVGLENIIDRNIRKKISMTEYFKSKTKEDIKAEL